MPYASRLELAVDSRAAENDMRRFQSRLNGVENAGENTANSVESVGLEIERMRSTMIRASGVLSGGAAAIGLMARQSADAAREIKNLSRLASTDVVSFQKMAVASRQFGIEQEQLAQIIQDTQDRIGDFLQTGQGEFVDFFENIAPKVGLTADALARMAGPEALQAIYNALEQTNLSAAETTFYMEALASDATRLIPLLKDNGQGFKDAANEAERLGVALSEIEIDKLTDLRGEFAEFETVVSSSTSRVMAEYSDEVTAALDGLGDGVRLLAENFDMLQNAAALAAGVMTARFLSSMAAGTSAIVSGIAATNAHTAALAENQAMEAGRAATMARTVAAEQNAAATRANIAAQRAAQDRAAIAQDAQRLASTQAALTAERALENQRLQAQISATGRQQSIARIAELRASEAAITNQLTAANVRLTEAEAAEASAKRAASLASVEKTRADAAATTAMGTYTAAATTAARANGVLATSARVAAGAMALVGGPAGAAMLAAGSLYYFREELGLVAAQAQTTQERIGSLTSSLAVMGETAVNSSIASVEAELRFLEDQAWNTQQAIANLGEGETFGGRDKTQLEAQLESISDDVVFARQELSELKRRRDELNKPEGDSGAASEGIRNIAEAAGDASKTTGTLTSELESLRRELDPAYSSQRRLSQQTDLLTQGLQSGALSLDEYLSLWDSAAAVYGDATDKTRELGDASRNAAAQADPFARSWEEAAERIDETFADAFVGAFDSFEDFSDQLLDGFKRLLAELAYQATLKPIVVGFTSDMQGMLGIGGGSGGSGGSGGWTNTIASAKSIYDQGLSAYGYLTGAGSAAAPAYTGWAGSAAAGAGAYTGWAGSAAAGSAAAGGYGGWAGSAAVGAAQSGTAAGAGSGMSGMMANAASMWPLAVIAGMLMSGDLYDAGVRPSARDMRYAGGEGAVGQSMMFPAAVQSQFFEGLDSALGGSKIAAMLTGSTFHQYLWEGPLGNLTQQLDEFIGLPSLLNPGSLFGSNREYGFRFNQIAEDPSITGQDLGYDTSPGDGTPWYDSKNFDDGNLGRGRTTAFGSYGFLDKEVVEPADMVQFLDTLEAADNAIAQFLDSAQTDRIKEALDGFYYKGDSMQDVMRERMAIIIEESNSAFEDAIEQLGGDLEAQFTALVSGLQVESVGKQLGEELGGSITDDMIVHFQRAIDSGGELTSVADGLMVAAEATQFLHASSERLGLRFDATADEAIHAAYAMQEMVGGIGNLSALQDQYYNAFYSEQERFAHLADDLRDTFSEMGHTLPDTRDGFRALVEAQDLNASAGREQYAALLSVVPAMDQYLGALEQQAGAAEGAAESVQDFSEALRARESLERELLQLQGDTEALREIELDSLRELAGAEEQGLVALQERIWAIEAEQAAAEDAAQAHTDLVSALEEQAQAARNAVSGSLSTLQNSIDAALSQDAAARDAAIASANAGMEAARAQAQAAQAAIQAQIGAENQLHDARMEQLSGQQSLMQDIARESERAVTSLQDALEKLGIGTAAEQAMRYSDAQSSLRSMLGGDIEQDALDKALGVVTQDNADMFGSATDYARDRAVTANLVSQLAGQASSSLSTEEMQLESLNSLIDSTQAQHERRLGALDRQSEEVQAKLEEQIAQFEEEMEQAKAQYATEEERYSTLFRQMEKDAEIAMGTWQGTLSVDEAVRGVSESIIAMQEAEALYQDALNGTISGAGDSIVRAIGASASSIARSLSSAVSAAASAASTADSASSVPAFASGGVHSGGLRLVGERGPELEVTGPSRIFSHSQTQSMFDMSGVIEELRALREDNAYLKNALREISKSTKKQVRLNEDWDRRGMPEQRSVEA